MRSRSVLLGLVLACGGWACSHRQTGFQPLAVAGTTADAEALVRAALVLDAAADVRADTLYSTDAVVFSNARQRFAHPRFAGVSYGGRVTLAASAVNMMGSWAWVVVDYRWISSQRQAEVGRATFILAKREKGWRIVHVHSSQLLPWDH